MFALVMSVGIIAPHFSVAACDRVAVGSLQLLSDSVLSPDNRFVLSYNVEAMLKGDGLNLSITSIDSQKTVKFRTKAQVLFQGASDDLHQILLSSALGDHSEFYIYNEKGDRVSQFKLPATNGPEEYVVRAGHDAKNDQWLIATNLKLYSYSLAQNKMKLIFEPQAQQDSVTEWFNFFNKTEPFVYADDGKSLLLLTTKMDIYGKLTSLVHVFGGTSLELQKTIEVQSQSSPLQFDQTHLLFSSDQSKSYDVVDIRSGQINHLNLPGEAALALSAPFFGPANTFGVFNGSQKIQLFSADLKVIEEVQIPNSYKWSKISVAGGSPFLILLDQDQVSTFLFDLKSKQLIRLPKAMNLLAYQYNIPIIKNQVFALLFNERITKSSLLQYNIQSQCVENLPSIRNGQAFQELIVNQGMTSLSYVDQNTATENSLLTLEKWTALSTSDKEIWKQSVKKFLETYLTIESITAMKQSYSRISEWLSIFQPVLMTYTSDEKETLIDTIAINLAEKLHKTSGYEEISISKLANLFVANLKPILGIPGEPRTEMVLLKDLDKDPSGKTIQPVVLGSSPIFDKDSGSVSTNNIDVSNSEGFYIKKDFPALTFIPDHPQHYSVQWRFNNQMWTASGTAELLSLQHLVNKEGSPKYEQLWSDQRMIGMVVLSPNLGEPMWLVRKYLSYFKDQGFDFGPTKMVWSKKNESLTDFFRDTYLFPQNTSQTNDFKTWFKNLISNGFLDYWIKEAHSGGNNEVIFVGKVNTILKGVKKINNGREEYIYIVYPSGESFAKDDQVPITNDEFGTWIREREKMAAPNQLVYINASCWSASKAQQEIIAARSPLLVEIPTSISTLTFQNSPQSHLQVLLTSLRNGLSYDQIQKNLDSVHTMDGTKNPYMLPNQVMYDTKVWNGLNSALDYSVNLEQK